MLSAENSLPLVARGRATGPRRASLRGPPPFDFTATKTVAPSRGRVIELRLSLPETTVFVLSGSRLVFAAFPSAYSRSHSLVPARRSVLRLSGRGVSQPRLRRTRSRRGKPRPRRDRISIAIAAYVARINIIISKSKAGPRPVSALLSFSPFHCLFHFFFRCLFPSTRVLTCSCTSEHAILALSFSASLSLSRARSLLSVSFTVSSSNFPILASSVPVSLVLRLFPSFILSPSPFCSLFHGLARSLSGLAASYGVPLCPPRSLLSSFSVPPFLSLSRFSCSVLVRQACFSLKARCPAR